MADADGQRAAQVLGPKHAPGQSAWHATPAQPLDVQRVEIDKISTIHSSKPTMETTTLTTTLTTTTTILKFGLRTLFRLDCHLIDGFALQNVNRLESDLSPCWKYCQENRHRHGLLKAWERRFSFDAKPKASMPVAARGTALGMPEVVHDGHEHCCTHPSGASFC